ncbi:MAG: protein translocase subunit SecF [Candidatus Marinimicrobia bacterium]|nr:protein translocase subunit SecF [Candidatus Neomarinimicrobiota bacterium]
MKFIENTKIKFMSYKKVGFALSATLAAGSLFLLMLGLNLGIDFKGGTAIGLSFDEEVSIQEIRSVMESISVGDQEFNLSTEEIKYFGSNKEIMIKIKSQDNTPENFGQGIVNHIYKSMPTKVPEDKNMFILSLGAVSPKVGSELSGKAFWSIISALVLILFYISIRFEFKFAIGAILALVHDIIITLGIFSLTGYEITLSTVAAFLTIVGYSLNDTIVILDRVRENMKSSGTVLFESTINKSINQSLSRTLITSLTTLFVIVVLLIYGGEVIRPFAFTMFVGVIVGTYSSIYIASALLATIYKSSN